MENNQTAARAAKRFLDERVRNDWQYPDVPPAWSASDEEVRDATEFRERYYGESESSDSDNDAAPTNGDSKSSSSSDPYKFDNPDSIGQAVDNKRSMRRRRRRERLEHDMAENEGLRIWVAQRDRWTGASSVAKYGTTRRTPSAAAVPPIDPPPGETSEADTFDVVPVAPRLLSDNAIRFSITPKAYPDIFQKIVVSSRTPAVPINLADVTAALVQGWKDTNEWPPRQGALDPLAGKKRGAAATAAHTGFMGRHPHLDKGVGSVKKMLHLSTVHADNAKER